MKIISKKNRDTMYSQDVIYQIDSLNSVDSVSSLFDVLIDSGYKIKRYVINFIQDHADFHSNVCGVEREELLKVLSSANFKDLESIDVVLDYNNIEVYGTAYVDSGVFRLSFQKKRDNVNKRI